MEFDLSRVYTAANADELKVGSKVIVADNLNALKERVKKEILVYVLGDICDESYERRFEISSSSHFSLAYLVSEPEEKKLKWSDLKCGDIIKSRISGSTHLVTAKNCYTTEDSMHIYTIRWISDKELAKEWEKVENE